MRLAPAVGPASIVFVDLETGDTPRRRAFRHALYGDWRDEDGLRMPLRVTTEQADTGRTIATAEEIAIGLEFGQGHFTGIR